MEAAGVVVEFIVEFGLETATVGNVEAEEATDMVDDVDKEA
jgi:hypothetical protein